MVENLGQVNGSVDDILHTVVAYGTTVLMLETLLADPRLDTTIVSSFGSNALHIAAFQHNPGAGALLLADGRFHVNEGTAYQNTPLGFGRHDGLRRGRQIAARLSWHRRQ